MLRSWVVLACESLLLAFIPNCVPYNITLKLAMVWLFTPWKLPNDTNQGLPSPVLQSQLWNIYQHTHGYNWWN